MDRNIEELELFDSYYRQELGDSDKNDFEKKLINDPDFRSRYEEFLIEISAIQFQNRKNLIQELTSSQPNATSTSAAFLKIAAVIAVFIAASILVYNYLKGPDKEDIYLAHYEKEQNLTLQKPRGISEDFNHLNNAYNSYLVGDYEQALKSLHTIENIEENPQALYVQGLIELELSNFSGSSAAFYRALEYDSPLTDNTKWYLGLSLLADGKTAEAIQVLQSIESEEYQAKAQKVMDELNQ